MVTVKALNLIYKANDSMKETLAANLEAVLSSASVDITAYDDKLEEIQGQLLKKAKSKEEYDEALVRAYFDKITVYDDHYEVTFKSGVSVGIAK